MQVNILCEEFFSLKKKKKDPHIYVDKVRVAS